MIAKPLLLDEETIRRIGLVAGVVAALLAIYQAESIRFAKKCLFVLALLRDYVHIRIGWPCIVLVDVIPPSPQGRNAATDRCALLSFGVVTGTRQSSTEVYLDSWISLVLAMAIALWYVFSPAYLLALLHLPLSAFTLAINLWSGHVGFVLFVPCALATFLLMLLGIITTAVLYGVGLAVIVKGVSAISGWLRGRLTRRLFRFTMTALIVLSFICSWVSVHRILRR